CDLRMPRGDGFERSHGLGAPHGLALRARIYHTVPMESTAAIMAVVCRTGVHLGAPAKSQSGVSARKERGIRAGHRGARLVAHAAQSAVDVLEVGDLAVAAAVLL